MASIRKRVTDDGIVRWEVQVRQVGHRTMTKTLDTEQLAKAWAREVERKIARGEIDDLDPTTQRTTVSNAIKSYREKVLPKMASKVSQEGYLQRIEDEFGQLYVANLRPAMIAQWLEHLAKPGLNLTIEDRRIRANEANARARAKRRAASDERQAKEDKMDREPPPPVRPAPRPGLSSQTVVHHLNCLSALINYSAKKLGVHLPAGNPVRLVERPALPPARTRRLLDGERNLLLRAARAIDNPAQTRDMECVIELALETAMRRGEILGLQWSFVQADMTRIALPAELTKTSTARTVPVSPRARAALSKLTRSIAPGALVITAWRSSSSFGTAWDKLIVQARTLYEGECAAAGSQPDAKMLRSLRFHDTRREAASHWAEFMELPLLQKVTGHKDPRTLTKHYVGDVTDSILKRMEAADTTSAARR